MKYFLSFMIGVSAIGTCAEIYFAVSLAIEDWPHWQINTAACCAVVMIYITWLWYLDLRKIGKPEPLPESLTSLLDRDDSALSGKEE